ncbi:Lipid A biosynthesis (KDO)2-(lauroyl)-lipid IVA acyltransferase [Marinomonas spartinae]|uniref:lauroyl-Kdo(2)-lipid IV(A) myristoyltransferase n=1 Tax=Marinomonas spartinae TaxID=1792290 RepID=UPI000808B4E7|nr:lauroyl-Kdo(2)-lipid IV(A) myristoyltransferase [Marinomonas spartinae]SBS24620.1 Lipid A biosynthesis (KDO)2-(lauroyl)-lipid IVA acyltransferase [Marinomonas spartinae]
MSIQDKYVHNPTFEWRFLLPQYWPTWIGLLFAVSLAFVPFRIRDKLASKMAHLLVTRKGGSTIKRARINLEQCFPEKSLAEREDILNRCCETALQFYLSYAGLLVRSKRHNQSKGSMIGAEHLLPLLDRGEKIIALVPHCWAIDYAAVMIAAKGYQVSTMMKPQKQKILDWLIHKQRMQYGGKIYPREVGIKPFLKSVKEGYLGYYLPDEDLGPQHSVFVPFFGAQKATMKGLGKFAKLTKAVVVPMLPTYNAENGQYELFILPALENFPTGDEEQDAIAMNQAMETLIAEHPEQYMWILNLLRSRPDGSKLY